MKDLEKDLEKNIDLINHFKKEKKFISFSMLNTIETCYRQYKFQYIDRAEKEENNIYTYLGSLAHSLIEKLYRNEINKNIACSEWEDKLNNCKYYFLDYTRSENEEKRNEMFEKNELYGKNYNNNMIHYFNNFNKLEYSKFFQEKKVFFEVGKLLKNDIFNKYVFSGIIDFIGVNDDGSLDIIDYKTSTIYKGSKYDLHSYQLILYAICLELLGYRINKIGWNFLKYVRKIKTFKNGNIRITNVERKDLKGDENFEDCMVYVDYNVENKKKALKYIYDNVLKMLRIDIIKHMNTNMLPYNYNEFFCQNLCPFFKICSVGS